MKKIILIPIFMIISCLDTSNINKSDLIKYNWLIPFIQDIKEIRGTFNLDTNEITFTSDIGNLTIQHFYDIALQEKWNILLNNEQELSLENKLNSLDRVNTHINIRILEQEILFHIYDN